MTTESKKAIIYIRVSDDHQVDGTSLEFQEQECRRYCERKGLEVVEIFREEGESAKDLTLNNRQTLLRALEYCRKYKKDISAFVVLRVDRFARNTEDHFSIRKILLDYGTTLHSVTEPIGSKPAEKFIETVLAGAAEYDNALRKQRCSDGMSQKINQGIWPWRPPIGYKCMQNKKHGEKKTQADPIDEVVFPIIQRGLKEYAKGSITQGELTRLLDSWGLVEIRGKKSTTQFTHTVLGTNLKFYAGILRNPWTGNDVKGMHQPMITDDERQQITAVRLGRSFVVKRSKFNPEFCLKPTVKCVECKRPLTGSHTKGNGGKYAYYHCYNRECIVYGKAIDRDDLEKQFAKKLKKVHPTQEFLKSFQAVVLDYWKEQGIALENISSKHEKELVELETKKKRIYEMREDGSYSKEEFLARKQEIENEMANIRIFMNQSQMDDFDMEGVLNFTNEFISDVAGEWKGLLPELKPQFQKLVLPEGILYDRKNGFGTMKLGLIYEINHRFHGDQFRLVDPAGIEPAASCLQSRRSTR
jgi:site-specific DNA recombinase